MPAPRKRSDQSLLQMMEEATELLRRLPARAWLWWLGGTTPFACGLLHFWNDMSRAASAWDRLPAASLMLALAYWWMKIAHCFFGDHLMRELRGDDTPPPLPWRGRLRLVTSQALIHGTTPWMLLLALAVLLPFGWVYAFYHNVTTLALDTFRKGGRMRDLVRIAIQQSHFRQGQNHGGVMLLLVFAGMVWMNWWSGVIQGASLSTSFTGSENMLTRNPMTLLSSTVFATTMTLAYLVTGPLVKAIFALRCFYGLARKNGEDLLVAFRRAGSNSAALLVMAVAGLSFSMTVHAQEGASAAPPAAAQQTVNGSDLGQSIEKVLQQDEFQWRMPRDARTSKEEKGVIASWISDMSNWVGDQWRSMKNTIEDWLKSLFKDSNKREYKAPPPSSGFAWLDAAQTLIRVLLYILAAVLIALLVRYFRLSSLPPVKAAGSVTPVDLESNQVIASQLPEDEWLRLAQEKIHSGDYRLAMRALFLGTLAHLGERRLLMIKRSKSNGDYVRELGLRARDAGDLRTRFSDSVRTFDWAWYGWHDVTADMLDQFRSNHQHIVSYGSPG